MASGRWRWDGRDAARWLSRVGLALLRVGLATLCFAAPLVAGSSQGTGSADVPGEAQPSFFGLTVNDFANVKPLLAFGTTRSWDAYPGLDWAEANPASGRFRFASLNRFIAINQARGAEMIYTFGRTPQWTSAQPNAPGPYGPGQCAPPDLAAWDEYVTAVVTRAAGRIHYWELWNEPNFVQFYCGDMATMVTMAQHAYEIIKRIDPTAQVLSPATAGPAGPAWLQSFLAGGGSSAVDIIAFHGYAANDVDVNALVNSYRALAATAAGRSLPLWDTEGGWGETAIGDDAHRAAFVAKFYALQWSLGVERVVWYSYDNKPTWGRLMVDATSLNAAGVAYRETYRWIVGATLAKPCSADRHGTWRCSLTRPGGYQAEIVWNSTRNIGRDAAPNSMVEYRDLAGDSHPIANGVVPVGNSPILIETGLPSN